MNTINLVGAFLGQLTAILFFYISFKIFQYFDNTKKEKIKLEIDFENEKNKKAHFQEEQEYYEFLNNKKNPKTVNKK